MDDPAVGISPTPPGPMEDYGGIFAGYPRFFVEKFKEFHEDNPEIWRVFVRLAYQALRSGRPRYSGYAIFQVVVWETNIQVVGDEKYKVSHDYIPLYIRSLIAKHPEFEGFFKLKRKRKRPYRGRGSAGEED